MRQREANLGPYRARPECPYLYARPDGHQISSSRAYRRTSRAISRVGCYRPWRELG